MKKTAAILLAAGSSSRTTHPKQLFQINGKPLVQFQIEALLDANITTVYVVVGYHSHHVIEAIGSNNRVKIVLNPTPEKGMFSSLLEGIKALTTSEERLLIHPVDVPITSSLTQLLQAEGNILIPSFNGKNGHPIIVKSTLVQSIAKEPQQRLDRWLERHRKMIHYIESADSCILLNANTDEELLRYFTQRNE